VIGAGCSKFGENYDMSAEDMIVSAAFDANTDAKIDPSRFRRRGLDTEFPPMPATPWLIR